MASKSPIFNYRITHANPLTLQLSYFLVLSTLGYFALKVSKPRTIHSPNDLNLLFTSVSATTVSSMSTIDMEDFSNFQLVIMTILMLLGGEVFTSCLGLLFQRCKFLLNQNRKLDNSVVVMDSIELGSIDLEAWGDEPLATESQVIDDQMGVKYNSIKILGYVVLGYHVIIHAIGITLVSIYISLTPSAHNVLQTKGLLLQTFSFFVVISTFSNCGFIPTNENMIVFRKNSGLLLILIPQIFLGNTLYSPCLRFVIWVLERFTKKKELAYMLKNCNELGYGSLKPSTESWFLGGTTIVFFVLQVVFFSAMEWSSGVMDGMTSYEKFVGSLFQSANSRHAGESIVDLSLVSSAVLALVTIMMYIPTCASFLPISYQQQGAPKDNKRRIKQKKKMIMQNMLFSQLSYLAIFVVIICITERKSLKEDPLNFNFLSILFEVISAYGNVGFSTGYSCKRRLVHDDNCQDKMYGFVGRWSNGGKFALILVMFFGRLKKFNMHGGKAWITLS